jgi:cellulose 1,4-beta-cellobiosidase
MQTPRNRYEAPHAGIPVRTVLIGLLILLLLGGCSLFVRPRARIMAVPQSGLPPLEVTFDGSQSTSNGGEILLYHWDFGDNTETTGRHVTHLYPSKGEFIVVLTVTDASGAIGDASMTITVRNLSPVASITVTPPIQEQTAWVRFDGRSSYDPDGAIVEWLWDFGDGTSNFGPYVEHRYDHIGTYTVLLRVIDDTGAEDVADYRMQIVGCGGC